MKGIKAVCVVLALMLAVSGGCLGVFADNVITGLTIIDLEEPCVGRRPDLTWSTAESGFFTMLQPNENSRWYESADKNGLQAFAGNFEGTNDILPDEPRFEEGFYYIFETSFKAASGYTWDGESIKNMIGCTAEEIYTEVNGDVLTIQLYYGPLTSEETYSVFIENVQEPSVGEIVDFSYTINEQCHCEPASQPGDGFWAKSSDGGVNFEYVQPGETFEYGYSYRFFCEVSPEPGYRFGEGLYTTVNERDARYMTAYGSVIGKYYAAIVYDFGRLGQGGITIRPVDGYDEFFTYYADKPFEAEVEIIGAGDNAVIKWYSCDIFGNHNDGDLIGEGKTVMLPGISSDDMMVFKYVTVIVENPELAGNGGAAIIPSVLYPMGIEFMMGDVDDDGEITDWDSILLDRYLAGWKVTINTDAADIDHDGEVTDWDSIILGRYLAGWKIDTELYF